MNFRDSNQNTIEVKYISKRVMVNGQFVTLYSANGQTWLSSPEDIPALMERLDNARVTLNTAEKVAEGEAAKVAEPEAKTKPEDKTKKEPQQEAPERALSAKYRMKGPKPRPILRQDGVVIKGTPIEPISASTTVMSFSSDVKIAEDGKPAAKSAKSAKPMKSVNAKDTKLIAPLVSKKVTKPSAKSSIVPSKGAGKVASKSTAPAAEVKSKAIKPVKQLAKVSKPVKQTSSAKAAATKHPKKVMASKGTKKAKLATSKSQKAPKKAARKAKKLKK